MMLQMTSHPILYTNIDHTLPNKSHGPMHYQIGVTWVYNYGLCCYNTTM